MLEIGGRLLRGMGGRGGETHTPQGRWNASSSNNSLKSSCGRAVLKIRVELKGAANVVHSLKYCDVTISCRSQGPGFRV